MNLFSSVKEASKNMNEALFGKNTNNPTEQPTVQQSTQQTFQQTENIQPEMKAPLFEQNQKASAQQVPTGEQIVTNDRSNVVIVRPKKAEQAEVVGSYLKNGKAVILNMSSLDETSQMKMLQFVIGVTFALNLKMVPIEQKVVLIDPNF